MTLARCKAALLHLIDDQENRVIALSGKWGTGKTELWKQVRGQTVDAKAKDAVLVSLFGVSTQSTGVAPAFRRSLSSSNTRVLLVGCC
ncbi:P-loop NTPase fold protein [Pseudomonas sp. KCJK8751]|uniref:P-loop NTPase fold protein n=1 Tax=unclassified Pseudomonas TaxID=196821 RepID=UPI00390627EE